jgi:hypothetical protein
MQKEFFATLCILIVAHAASASASFGFVAASPPPSQLQASSLSAGENQILTLVNGSRTYDYDLELERIALQHYAFRSAGSEGANESATWIKRQFEGFGIQTWLEPFQFTNWTLLSKPSLIIDEDGNWSTTADQISMPSFQSEQYSWPAPAGGVFADLAVLALPLAAGRYDIGANPINMTAWNAVNTTGKIVLVGREIRWDNSWQQTFVNKLSAQRPAAVVYTWWYSWMSFTPPMYSSIGGLPGVQVDFGTYYWNLHIPVGFVDYGDGLLIRQTGAAKNVAAHFSLEAKLGYGTHYNVVGRILGSENPQRLIIISSHYDSVMCSGFCDNGAGTAGIIELAKVFSESVKNGLFKPRCTFLFIAFTGEELWMVGSIHYVGQHISDMPNIVAVINLDCIGSNSLYVTQTDPGPDFDLYRIIASAASDLGISIRPEAAGGSDQEAFRNPYQVDSWCVYNWGESAGASNAIPVASSAMIISYPLIYSDLWSMGSAGWIHTVYDNSTSTNTLGWVRPGNLEDQLRVAALSVIRISTATSADFLPYVLLGLVVVIVPISALLIVRKLRQTRVQE